MAGVRERWMNLQRSKRCKLNSKREMKSYLNGYFANWIPLAVLFRGY